MISRAAGTLALVARTGDVRRRLLTMRRDPVGQAIARAIDYR